MSGKKLDFCKGMDISFLPQCLDGGMQVKDVDGTEMEPFALLKKYGVNSIRLRIWVNPENVPQSGGYCSLGHTLRMAKQIKENSMSFMLDFHYSDFWADPGKQKKPKAWEDLSREQLEEKVYTYTRDTLLAFEAQGTLPDIVQIGNEIRSGLLFPEGELPDYEGMVRLINAGIRGARSVADSDRMQVMIHLDQGGRYSWLHQWFEGAFAKGLMDFDLIGLSYYPFWHGTYLDVKASMEQLIKDYGKPIMIVETAYAWRKSAKGFIDEEQIRIGGLPAAKASQKKVLEIVMYLLASLPDNMGRGIYYWEPICVPRPGRGGWAENMGLLDEDGRAMEGIAAFALSEEEMAKEPACWKEIEEKLRKEKGSEDYQEQGENLLANRDFAKDWHIQRSDEDVKVYDSEGESGGTFHIFNVESPRNFKFQMDTGVQLEADSYIVSVTAKGVDTTGVDIRLFAEYGKKRLEMVIHPVERWTNYRLELPEVPEGSVKVGIAISSPPICFSIKKFGLTKKARRLIMSAKYTYNSNYLMKDGIPWFPVMGEMHYTRYNEELWEESLRKMKAGGVTIVSTYIIWLHHEEEKGIFDFSGCRNLKKFVELCRKVDIKVCLRLGPWVHGECRNGGFPDWVVELLKEGVKLRSNDETYMYYVRRFWEQVFEQVKGQMDEDGGPVIGVQLENEYGHVGGLKGEPGEAHMRALMALAKELGFRVPIYTATGWGGAVIGDALPVMGGYCDAPWDQSIKELSANTNFIMSNVRNDKLIASDHNVEDAVTFDESKFPYLTAELGGGLQVTGHRRPVATGKDIGAMSITKLASGVALLGYYMYHGGSNPKGKLSTLQESRATSYINYNDLPEINYDFNAPIRQYGTISDSYKELKMLAAFLQDFGADIATLSAEIDPINVKPEDMHTLRKSCRHDDTHGYVFFNNYVRRRTMDAHPGVIFKGITANSEVEFPAVDIASGTYGFFPYNMQLGEAVLETALATPYCRLEGDEAEVFVFYGDYEPKYTWKDGRSADILHLTRQQALNAFKVTLDKDYVIINDNYVWEQDGKLVVIGDACTEILTYPELAEVPEGFVKKGTEGRMTVYARKADSEPATAEFTKVSEDADSATYEITVSYSEKSDRATGRDTFLWLSYAGYGMEVYCGEEKINDHFYTGQQVPISLGYFDFPEKLLVKVNVLKADDWVYLEEWPELENGRVCRLNAVAVTEEYR